MRRLKKKKPDILFSTTSEASFFPSVQKKLTVGHTNDAYETEADTLATKVVAKNALDTSAGIQKKGSEEEEAPVQKMEEEEPVQEKASEDKEPVQKMEEEEPIQKKQKPENDSLQSRLKKKKGNGQSLPKQLRLEMNEGFGADFSSVCIHTDKEAVLLCQELGAQAFTHGNDIYFNEGKFNPNSVEGKRLLAHELTHTLQQGAMTMKEK